MGEQITNSTDERNYIDILALFSKIWKGRKIVFKWFLWSLLISLVIVFSMPKEYLSTVSFTPDASQPVKPSGIGALAGLTGGGNSNANSLLIDPELFPDIVYSDPFIVELLKIDIPDNEGVNHNIYGFIMNDVKSPWWSFITKLPGRVIGKISGLFTSEDLDERSVMDLDPWRMRREDGEVAEVLRSRIKVDIDEKRGLYTINSKMQDPVMAAALTDSVFTHLTKHIIDYNTKKAKNDLDSAQKLHDEAKEEFSMARDRLAAFIDRNRSLSLQSSLTKRDELEDEKNIKWRDYDLLTQELTQAKIRVQENTPVFRIIEPVSVPYKASSPNKKLILVAVVFLGTVLGILYVMSKENLLQIWRKITADDDNECTVKS